MVELHRNGLLVRFLVGVLAISAQRGRYHRFNTGTIIQARYFDFKRL